MQRPRTSSFNIEHLEDRQFLTAQMLLDLNSTPIGLEPHNFIEYQNEVYFSTTNVESKPLGIWKTDGSEAGTSLLAEPAGTSVIWIEEVGGKLLIAVEEVTSPSHQAKILSLYGYSDGTFAKIVELNSENPYGPYIGPLIKKDTDLAYFPIGLGGPGGMQIWSTDGETARAEKDSNLSGELTKSGAKLYFTAPQGGRTLHRELWSYDTNSDDATGVLAKDIAVDNWVRTQRN